MDLSVLHRYLDAGGSDAILMISDPAYDELRHRSSIRDWRTEERKQFYRGAYVERHDEWSWGWMVRRASGSYVAMEKPDLTPEHQ